MVFHMPINGLGTHLKRVWSGDHRVTCDCVDDQSLGRSCDTFPGLCACISHDPKVVKVSCDQTCNRSCDGFPGSCGWRVDSTMWLYFGLGAGLRGLGLGILWMHDIMDSVLDIYTLIVRIKNMDIASSPHESPSRWSRYKFSNLHPPLLEVIYEERMRHHFLGALLEGYP